MSAPEAPRRPRWVRIARWIGLGLLVVFVLGVAFILLALMAFGSLPNPFGPLLTGWWSFLARTIPAIHFNPDLLAMAALCALLVLAGSHRFLSWLSQTVIRRAWPWRWTWCGLSGIAILFLVGMSVGGIVHQIGWIAAGPEPLSVPTNLSPRYHMHQLQNVLVWLVLNESNVTVARIRTQARTAGSDYFDGFNDPERHRSLLETYQVLLIVEADGRVAGAIYHPRSLKLRARLGGEMISAHESKSYTPSELNEAIQQRQGQLIAL